MQIYGDSTFRLDRSRFARELSNERPDEDLSALRAILIACGQLEQSICDDDAVSSRIREHARAATECAAAAFYSRWCQAVRSAPRVDWQVESQVQQMHIELRALAEAQLGEGTLKLPEGFAFYALFPEQYCAAAMAYLEGERGSHPPRGTLHVIGLRSIGTTLSAAVAIVLKAAGLPYRRYTVRPTGHPFARRVRLPMPLREHDQALVVDEGPGLSGSSFFAVASALAQGGVSETRQAYFCAHPHPPGVMASRETQAFWQRSKRYVASARGDGPLAREELATLRADVARFFQSPVCSISNLSPGKWRARTFSNPEDWPPAYSAFERPKWLAQLADGRAVLLKFYGQVTCFDAIEQRLECADALAQRTIAASGTSVLRSHGYVARVWQDGRALTRADKGRVGLAAVSKFLGNRGWPLVADGGRAADSHMGCSGRLAPQEWLLNRAGRAIKLPETIQGYDHTAIDRQPLGWDLAAAIVEWELNKPEVDYLLQAFVRQTGIVVATADLTDYMSHYARFHAEMAEFCAGQADAEEARRLRAEAARYSALETVVRS